MSFEYVADPAGRPSWQGVLPGRPAPFFLRAGEGEHSKLFGDHFSVLLSGDETDGQFGMFVANAPQGDVIPAHTHDDTHETFFVIEGRVRVFVVMPDGEETSTLLGEGDFGFVPAGIRHAYRVEAAARMLGTATGGFERFFQQAGTPTDRVDPSTPPYLPDLPAMGAVAARHRMRFHPGHAWRDA